MAHSILVLTEWDRLMQIVGRGDSEAVVVDGNSLDLATVVAVARYLFFFAPSSRAATKLWLCRG